MITFTQIPPTNSPIGRGVAYTIVSTQSEAVDIGIIDAPTNKLIGVRRVAGGGAVTIDVAPFLRPDMRFAPVPEKTGLYLPTDRIRTIVVSAQYVSNSRSVVYAPARVVMPFEEPSFDPATPELITTMPRHRLIAANQSDELSFYNSAGRDVRITSWGSGGEVEVNYTTPNFGLHILRLDMNDFPNTDTLIIDSDDCGEVHYTVITQPRNARRLGWRTQAGSVEYYTFPIERSVSMGVSKKRIYGVEGHTAASTDVEQRIVIGSAFEKREVLEAVAEVASSPEVWLLTEQGHVPVDVTTESLVTHRRGEMSNLEIEIRLRKPRAQVWS